MPYASCVEAARSFPCREATRRCLHMAGGLFMFEPSVATLISLSPGGRRMAAHAIKVPVGNVGFAVTIARPVAFILQSPVGNPNDG
jgi:hypothetical protein